MARVQHVPSNDYSAVINRALELPGFTEADAAKATPELTVGCAAAQPGRCAPSSGLLPDPVLSFFKSRQPPAQPHARLRSPDPCLPRSLPDPCLPAAS